MPGKRRDPPATLVCPLCYSGTFSTELFFAAASKRCIPFRSNLFQAAWSALRDPSSGCPLNAPSRLTPVNLHWSTCLSHLSSPAASAHLCQFNLGIGGNSSDSDTRFLNAPGTLAARKLR